MSDEMIDAIIAEHSAAAQPTPETPTPESTPQEPTEVKPETTEAEPSEPEADVKDKAEEMFPKKAVNALSRRDKKIGQLKAEKQQLLQELEAARKGTATKPEAKDGAPKESDYETYGEYLRAEARFAARQELLESQSKQKEESLKSEINDWREERNEYVAENANEAKKTLPEFQKVMAEAKPFLDALPTQYADLFLESDNPVFAAYAMQKEGILEDLASMSVAKAALTIGRMADKGLELSKPKKSNAPTPMTPAKGNAVVGKPLEQKSASELLEWVNS